MTMLLRRSSLSEGSDAAGPHGASAAWATGGRGLVLAIHDVSPKFTDRIDRLVELIAPLTGAASCAMLVVPDHWREAPIRPGSDFSRRLRDWSDAGIEMMLHGWCHRDESVHEGWSARFRARHFTAGEGEFLGLSREEATARLTDGRALLEDVLGKPVTGFVAPAWLYSEGALKALAECGFTLAEDHMHVWNPTTGAVLAKGPVISWASRSKSRIASSLMFARVAPLLLARQRLVRIALHPGDVTVPSLVESIRRTIGHFAEGREVMRYAALG